MRRVLAMVVAAVASLTLLVAQPALAQEGRQPEPTTGPASPSPTSGPTSPNPASTEETKQTDELGGSTVTEAGDVVHLATFEGFAIDSAAQHAPPAPALTVDPIAAAGRVSEVVSALDEPCAVRADGSSDGSAVTSLGAQEQAAQDSAYEAERRETEGASSDEILDFINGDDGASPMSGQSGAKGTTKTPARQKQQPVAQTDHAQHTDAAIELLQQLNAADAAAAAAADTTATPTGEPDGPCEVPYVCAAERVDDVISGHIDSETDGAYLEYVQIVADNISVLQATIREAESAPPGGAETPTISDPSSPERVLSLAGTLADIGLNDPPSDLYLPVFNYCRIGPDGDIQTDPDADPRVLPVFTWTRLEDEFDVPGTSADIFDQISRALFANLPDMRTIPPIEKGVTIVQFPMWLWLNEPFTYTEVNATSELNLISMQGRATFDHVTWTLGDNIIECTLDEMRAYVPNTRLDQVENPKCHHIFTELTQYQMTAAVTYRIDQQISIRGSTTRPFNQNGWQPHPINNYVTIQSTTGPIRVEEIYAINIPIDMTDEELAALRD